MENSFYLHLYFKMDGLVEIHFMSFGAFSLFQVWTVDIWSWDEFSFEIQMAKIRIYILNRVHIHSCFSPQLRRAGTLLEHGDSVEWWVHVRRPRLLWPQRPRGPRGGGHQTRRGRGLQVQGGLQVGAHSEHPGQCDTSRYKTIMFFLHGVCLFSSLSSLSFSSRGPEAPPIKVVNFVSNQSPWAETAFDKVSDNQFIWCFICENAKLIPRTQPALVLGSHHVSLIINEFTLVHATVEFSFKAKSFDSKLTWDCTLHTICHSK